MTKPLITSFNQLSELLIQKYERYLPTAFDESLTLLQKVNKIIEYLNQTGQLVNDVVVQWNEVMEWVMGEGLNESVENKLDEMVLDGTLDTIINSNIFNDLNQQLKDIATSGRNDLQTVINNAVVGDVINIANTHTFTAPLILKSGITLKGRGKLIFNIASAYVMDLTDLNNITVDGLTIEVNGDVKTNYAHGLFKLNNTTDILIQHTKITTVNRSIFNFTGLGDLQLCKNIKIHRNQLKTTGDLSFIYFSQQRNDVTDTITTNGNENIEFVGNHVVDSPLGLLLDGDNLDISENYFKNVNAPIAMLKVRNVVVNRNRLIGFSSNAIALGNGSDDIIENAIVSNNVLDGLLSSQVHGINLYKQGGDGNPTGSVNLGKSKHVSITGNTVKNCGATGIFAYGNGNVTISGNAVSNNRGGGILVNTPATQHPGNLVITGNEVNNNGATGIAVSPTNSVYNVIVSDNISMKNAGRGIYLAKVWEAIISNNMCVGNQGEGLFANNVRNSQILGNRMTGNLTGASEFNGNLVLSLVVNNGVILKDNIVSTFYSVTSYEPDISTGNIGAPNRDGLFTSKKYANKSNTQTVSVNVPLPASSANLTTQFLVQVNADRAGSSDLANHHQACLAIVTVMRYTNITIGDIVYLFQNTGTVKATVSVVANADNASVDVTGASNYASTDNMVITVSPLRSSLFNNL